MILEVCVGSPEDAWLACESGADRIELNQSLELGGVTPSAGSIELAVSRCSCPVFIMIRPRGGGFHYGASEVDVMERDIRRYVDLGVAGFVFGALTEQCTIDESVCRRLITAAGGLECVFHRAFDLVADPEAALAELIDLGIARVLTSGQSPTAFEGAGRIARWREIVGDRLEILPGGGISADNVLELVRATGCSQVHGSFSRQRKDRAGTVCSSTFPVVDPEAVRAIRRVLDGVRSAP